MKNFYGKIRCVKRTLVTEVRSSGNTRRLKPSVGEVHKGTKIINKIGELKGMSLVSLKTF